MENGKIIINDNLSETIEYNSPTTPIKAALAKLSYFTNGITPAHWHKELELIVVLDGSMTYYVNNNTYVLNKGYGIIVNSNRLHICGPCTDSLHSEPKGPITITKENECTYAVLLLHPDTLRFNRKMEKKYINPLLFDIDSNVFFLDHSENWHEEAIAEILDIYNAVSDKIACYELIAQSKFFTLWTILYLNTVGKNGYELAETDPMNPLKTMISYIQEHYQEKVTLTDVAESGMMCQSKCCRLFRDALRQSPIEYLQNYRISKGVYLLEHTDLSVTEIALECGFQGASYFTEIFKKLNGLTPKEYRKQTKLNALI